LVQDTRRLAAIVSADVVGYSRLMGRDEAETLAALQALRNDLIDPLISEHRGRIVKAMGDGLLLEFPSVISAVSCSLSIQNGVQTKNDGGQPEKAIRFRIGIHLGDVIVEGEDIFGDSVNIAARLQEISEPGGLALSSAAYEYLDETAASIFADKGMHDLKNIRRPIRVWQFSNTQRDAAPSKDGAASIPTPINYPTIAVMPFKNLSGDPDQEYFADGLTEDIITAISYWRSFPVIARNSTFSFKGKSIRPKDVASELGARYILEGSVRKAGNRVRVSASLADADHGHELWADRYDRPLDDIFDLQDEITQKVAVAIGFQVERAEIARSSRMRNSDITAWDLLARGLPHFYEHTCEGNARAREFFEQAVVQAPGYSDGWAYLAWAYGHDLMIGCSLDRETTGRLGIEAGRRAVSLDENSALAHLALSSIYVWTGNAASGLDEAKLALDLNPNEVRAGFAVGNRLALAGRAEEGIAQIKAALALNPRDPYRWHYFGYLARTYLSQDDPDQALNWARQAVQLRPDQAEPRFRLALCHAHLDQLDGARRELAICEDLSPGFIDRRRSWEPYPDATRNDHLLAPLRKNGLL